MRELPPDRAFWNPIPRFQPRAVRRAAFRQAAFVIPLVRSRAVRKATSADASRVMALVALAATLELLRWLMFPRSRVVWRARLDPGDRLQMVGQRRG